MKTERRGGRRKGAGRPVTLKDSEQVTLRIDHATAAAVAHIMRRVPCGKSEAVRRAIMWYGQQK